MLPNGRAQRAKMLATDAVVDGSRTIADHHPVGGEGTPDPLLRGHQRAVGEVEGDSYSLEGADIRDRVGDSRSPRGGDLWADRGDRAWTAPPGWAGSEPSLKLLDFAIVEFVPSPSGY